MAYLGKKLAIISIYSKMIDESKGCVKSKAMAEKDYTVEGRRFFSEKDYAHAKRDKEIIDGLRRETDLADRDKLERLRRELREEKYRFYTILGRDFLEEVEGLLKKADAPERAGKGISSGGRKQTKISGQRGGKPAGTKKASGGRTRSSEPPDMRKPVSARSASSKTPSPGAGSLAGRRDSAAGRTKPERAQLQGTKKNRTKQHQASTDLKEDGAASGDGKARPGAEERGLDSLVAEALKRRERRRRLMIAACSVLALCCLGYFGLYSYYDYRTEQNYRKMSMMKESATSGIAVSTPNPAPTPAPPLYTLDGEPESREVLEEYKNLLIKNKKLIGWIKIDDTNIDYPVMQTTDNEYYLDHNTQQERDINGAIFMDKDCDVLKPSTNYILYGHHMVNGKMFGKLYLYQKESYYKEHQYISFDTIYEKGTYQVMYVFPAKVHKETEIVFKYYQFIDANSAQEFDSYMQEMADMSLYDTGVTAQYGDQLLTVSTCDNQSTEGRFVVVAKKIAKE